VIIIKKYFEYFKTIAKTKIEGEKQFLSIERYNFTLNNGQIITRERLLKNNKDGSASIILPITDEGKIILTIEPRVFTKRTVDIGLPAGYIEDGETPLESAKRELLEELTVELLEAEFLGEYFDKACFSDKPISVKTYLTKVKGEIICANEIKEAIWIDRNYQQKNIKLGSILEKYVIPELIKRNLM